MSGAKSGPAGLVDHIEETLIALLLGLMTAVTFANVIARFFFNSNILWALELTVFMFGWLVLLGASYAVKKHAHLGVDAILNMLAPAPRRILALIAVACCLVFSLLMLKGPMTIGLCLQTCRPHRVAGFRPGSISTPAARVSMKLTIFR